MSKEKLLLAQRKILQKRKAENSAKPDWLKKVEKPQTVATPSGTLQNLTFQTEHFNLIPCNCKKHERFTCLFGFLEMQPRRLEATALIISSMLLEEEVEPVSLLSPLIVDCPSDENAVSSLVKLGLVLLQDCCCSGCFTYTIKLLDSPAAFPVGQLSDGVETSSWLEFKHLLPFY